MDRLKTLEAYQTDFTGLQEAETIVCETALRPEDLKRFVFVKVKA